MKIKICGITNLADARLCRDLGVDFIGLIRAASERKISPAGAAEIAKDMTGSPQPVLLFRDAPVEEVGNEVGQIGAAWVQLHGGEDAAYAAELREKFPRLRLIKAVEIFPAEPAGEIRLRVTTVCDALKPDVILLDRPKGGGSAGFEELREAAKVARESGIRVWCAGGLTPENVVDVVRGNCFDGVDVARGVEMSPGKKSVELVTEFVKRVRDHTIF